jgi:hypothetical protein
MTRITIVRQIENAAAGKMRTSQKNQKGRKTALRKPCGHAAPVDSSATHPADLPTSAWTTLRVDHMPTRPTTTFASLKRQGTTAGHLLKKGSFE